MEVYPKRYLNGLIMRGEIFCNDLIHITKAEHVQKFTVLFSFYFVSNVILKCRVFLRVWQLPDGPDRALLH